MKMTTFLRGVFLCKSKAISYENDLFLRGVFFLKKARL